MKHYKDQDTRFYFEILYAFLTFFSTIIFIGSISSLYSVITKNKDIEYKLINDKLFIKYNIFVLKLINKKFNINLKNNNEINISEIREIKIDSPNKLFKNCLFIKLNNDETYPLFGLSDPTNIKMIIENKIKEELNQDTESKK
ncbi:hypothetical protein [Mycoplasmopsis edwardii]|uniref:Uncharacterized protein n=1 Tax=Mycoplasmopsis edwardii TaxID=53558 RepID=A0ACD4PHV3_9BACT|nr:hypothetical protein [Mycoplasmopsis edwardii]WBP84241.1 hypothetical protein Me_995_000215 [Mycoplasmopsis edwardii]